MYTRQIRRRLHIVLGYVCPRCWLACNQVEYEGFCVYRRIFLEDGIFYGIQKQIEKENTVSLTRCWSRITPSKRLTAHRDGGGTLSISILRCRKITVAAINGHAVRRHQCSLPQSLTHCRNIGRCRRDGLTIALRLPFRLGWCQTRLSLRPARYPS